MNIRRRPPNPRIKVANLEYSIPHDEEEPRNILEKIVWQKDREVELSRQKVPLQKLKSQIEDLPPTRNFIEAIKTSSTKPAVIAEIKKASPSKGVIREDFNPISICQSYIDGGAACISVLTDKTFFQGGFEVLVEVRKTANIPILCKDFILTPYQLYQARAAGADAALLIAAILSDQDLSYLYKVGKNLGLTILVEVHNSEEMERVLNLGFFELIGINNRNLANFTTNLLVTEALAKEFSRQIKDQKIILVSESGIKARKDLDKVSQAGAEAVLVGEHLMSCRDILKGLRKLISINDL